MSNIFYFLSDKKASGGKRHHNVKICTVSMLNCKGVADIGTSEISFYFEANRKERRVAKMISQCVKIRIQKEWLQICDLIISSQKFFLNVTVLRKIMPKISLACARYIMI